MLQCKKPLCFAATHPSYTRAPGQASPRFFDTRQGKLDMLTLTHDQRGLLEYLASRVHELSIAATGAGDTQSQELLAEATELQAIRAKIVSRFESADAARQLQLPLDAKKAA